MNKYAVAAVIEHGYYDIVSFLSIVPAVSKQEATGKAYEEITEKYPKSRILSVLVAEVK